MSDSRAVDGSKTDLTDAPSSAPPTPAELVKAGLQHLGAMARDMKVRGNSVLGNCQLDEIEVIGVIFTQKNTSWWTAQLNLSICDKQSILHTAPYINPRRANLRIKHHTSSRVRRQNEKIG